MSRPRLSDSEFGCTGTAGFYDEQHIILSRAEFEDKQTTV